MWRAATCLSVLLFPLATAAHHNVTAGYDMQRRIELEGELTGIRWQNPHILMTLAVTDSQGRTVVWELESLSANGVGRSGITAALFSLGDRIKVAGGPSRRGLDRLWVTNVLLPSQQEVVMGPQVPPRWSERVLRGMEAAQATEGIAANAELGIFRVWVSARDFRMRILNVATPADPLSFPLTAAGRAEVERLGTAFEPTVGCVPKSMPGIMNQPYPLEFVRQADTILLKIEEYDVVRTIQLEAATDAAARAPSLLGYSRGTWDGPVLTVTTTDVAVRPFSGPAGRLPLGAQAVFVERFAPSEDGASLDYRMVITDPMYLTEPVTLEKRWINVPGTQVLPYECKQ